VLFFRKKPLTSNRLVISTQRLDDRITVSFSGAMVLSTMAYADQELRNITGDPGGRISFDVGGVNSFDSAGAWLIYRSLEEHRHRGMGSELVNASDSFQTMIDQLTKNSPKPERPQARQPVILAFFAEIGIKVEEVAKAIMYNLAFLGNVMIHLAKAIIRPGTIRWNALSAQIEHGGIRALTIIGLMSLTIGFVIVQQGAYQLSRFGAQSLVINMVAFMTLRELGSLMTAIMMAGRSGSAFTAEIGTMKQTEEIDALRTTGLDPIDVLVLPRLIAMIVVMPLLNFFSCTVAIIGAMLYLWLNMDVTPQAFLQQFHDVVVLNDFLVGMIKAPIFGLIIAVISCFEGMRVEGNTESLRIRTTMSVVRSIFMVIVLDAIFAVIFTALEM